MTKCPSCDHESHESFCPACGCEDYAKLTGESLTARPVAGICPGCGHPTWFHKLDGCMGIDETCGCEQEFPEIYPSGKCRVCLKPLDDHVKVSYCSY